MSFSSNSMPFKSSSFLAHTLANESGASVERIELENGVCLELWDTGVLRCIPAANTAKYRVLISCGIHGNETAPMEIVDQLVSDIKANRIEVNNHVLFVIGNPAAANNAKRFIDDNMNRLFSAAHENYADSLEADRAAMLEAYASRFFTEDDLPRLHYDLHTAIRGSEFEKFVVYPYREDQQWSKPQLGFLERCGLQAVLLSNKPSTTFSYYTWKQFSAHAFTVELGAVKPFGQNDMSRFKAMASGLANLIQGQEFFCTEPTKLKVFSVVEEVIKLSEAFELHVRDDAKNFTASPKGTVLASDQGYQYKTQQDGERFVFPIKDVPPGNRAMLVIAPAEL